VQRSAKCRAHVAPKRWYDVAVCAPGEAGPAALVDDAAVEASSRIGRHDLECEEARYGADTRGGVGVSIPV